MQSTEVLSANLDVFTLIRDTIHTTFKLKDDMIEWPFFFPTKEADGVFVVPDLLYNRTKRDFVHKKEEPKPYKTKLGRVVRRLVDKDVKDDAIRKFVEEIVGLCVGAELKFANTPDEYLKMHTCQTSSCMQAYMSGGKLMPQGVGTDAAFAKLNIHKSIFYALNPYVQGAYIEDNRGVAARAFLYTCADKVVRHSPARGRKYDLLFKLLSIRGYKPLQGTVSYTPEYSYSFEPLELNGEKIHIPLAHADDINAIPMAYDKASGRVIVGHPKGRNIWKYENGGWTTINNIPQV